MSIISFTGYNINDTIKQKLSIKEKRYITSRTIIYFNSNEIYTKRLKILFKILNKKVKFINSFYRNYKIREFNKLNNCYKRLHFTFLFNKINNELYLCDDIIYKIFNSLKIIKK